MVNRDEVPPTRCDLGHGALAERHFSITRTARKGTPCATGGGPIQTSVGLAGGRVTRGTA